MPRRSRRASDNHSHGSDGDVGPTVFCGKDFTGQRVGALKKKLKGLADFLWNNEDLVREMISCVLVAICRRCPFSALGLTAEAGSTITFPALLGHQAASWVLMSSEWLDADTCRRLGLAFATVADDALLAVTQQHAQILAAQPLASLMTTKELLMVPRREALREAHEVEGAAMASLMGGVANQEAISAFKQKRTPDFSKL